MRPFAASLLLIGAAVANAQTVADDLAAVPCATGTATYEVLMPTAAEPVTYTIRLAYDATRADSLAPCAYLIDWTLPRSVAGTDVTGFTAYHDGNHYRHTSGRKLQEYHYADDPVPFGNAVNGGVQNQAQFADLLPPFIARRLEQMGCDSTFIYTTKTDAHGRVTVRGVQRVAGYDALEFDYTFADINGRMLPVETTFEYNPASISEQSVTIKYNWDIPGACPEITEAALVDGHSEAFEQWRTSNFGVRSLVGKPLPEITAPTPTGERYTHHRGEAFRAPTVVAFIDPAVDGAAVTVSAIRQGLDAAPVAADAIFVFTSNAPDEIEPVMGHKLRQGEHVLMSARSAARDCGITAWPTMIFCDAAGNVADIEIGVNNDTATIVSQKTTLCL